MIPKIIHYCWLSGDEVPENLKKCMDSWKKIIPDYEFVKWDFTKFDKSSSAWVSEAFDNRKYAFACDYIRLYAVYNYGGIYLDMDMEVLKRFDDFLKQQYMLAYERESCKGIEAGCFGAEPHSEYIKRCLDYYTDRHFIKEDGSFDQLPLPQIMQAELDKMKINTEVKTWDYFTAKSYETGIISPTLNTYTIHHFAGSWKTPHEAKTINVYRYFATKYRGKKGHVFGRICSFPYRVRVKVDDLGFASTAKFAVKKVFKRV